MAHVSVQQCELNTLGNNIIDYVVLADESFKKNISTSKKAVYELVKIYKKYEESYKKVFESHKRLKNSIDNPEIKCRKSRQCVGTKNYRNYRCENVTKNVSGYCCFHESQGYDMLKKYEDTIIKLTKRMETLKHQIKEKQQDLDADKKVYSKAFDKVKTIAETGCSLYNKLMIMPTDMSKSNNEITYEYRLNQFKETKKLVKCSRQERQNKLKMNALKKRQEQRMVRRIKM